VNLENKFSATLTITIKSIHLQLLYFDSWRVGKESKFGKNRTSSQLAVWRKREALARLKVSR